MLIKYLSDCVYSSALIVLWSLSSVYCRVLYGWNTGAALIAESHGIVVWWEFMFCRRVIMKSKLVCITSTCFTMARNLRRTLGNSLCSFATRILSYFRINYSGKVGRKLQFISFSHLANDSDV